MVDWTLWCFRPIYRRISCHYTAQTNLRQRTLSACANSIDLSCKRDGMFQILESAAQEGQDVAINDYCWRAHGDLTRRVDGQCYGKGLNRRCWR